MEINDNIEESSYLTDAGYYCHEKHEEILPLLDSAQFWIEGVTLTGIAIVGLFGNFLTIIVLLWFRRGPHINTPNSTNQSSFNAILICLVTFDTFFLLFSLFDSAFVMSQTPNEPEW